ncbi:MAG: hypothetical protein ACTSRC_20735 [Candidatus Helarchaeota archaeon]
MINIIFQEGLEDQRFLRQFSINSEKLQKYVREFTPQPAESICKVPAEKIISLTRKFAETPRALIYGRMGICASTFSTLNVWAIEVLNIITGKLDRPGGEYLDRIL